MKKFRIPLLLQVLIAVALGLALGSRAPGWFVSIFEIFNQVFSEYLGFCIPLIILGLVASGIAGLGNRAGKLLLLTVAIAYGSTLFSGFSTYGVCHAVFPQIIKRDSDRMTLEEQKESERPVETGAKFELPPIMGVLPALVLAFVLSVGISVTQSQTLLQCVSEFKNIVEMLITWTVVPLLPLFIFGTFLGMMADGQALELLNVFGRVIGVVFVLHFALLFLQYGVAGWISHKNPVRAFWTMLPAYFTALGTSSSAATIPVTLAQVKKNGVRGDLADFCVPLCATIHLAGSTMKITAFSLVIVILNGLPIDFQTYSAFIFLLGITMVAAPGVPGGAIVAASAILISVLGFNESQVATMVALYIVTDCFGTACNVCGDGAIALVLNRVVRSSGEEGCA